MSNASTGSSAWGEINKSRSGGKGSINNLKLEDGKTVEVRFTSEPKKILKYWVEGKSAQCADRDNCIIHKKYRKDDGTPYEPEVRFVIQVIDRADGKLKILECPPSVLKPVAAWGERRGRNPADPKQGIDFSITRTGQKKKTRYEVVQLDPSPLTDEEVAYIEANKYDLDKLFKPTPDNEIEAKLGFVEAAASTGTTASKSAEPVAAGSGAGENKGVDLPF